MDRGHLAEGFLKETGFQLRLESRKNGRKRVLEESSRLEVFDTILKGPLTEGFCADSWDSKEFLISRRVRTRG